MSKAKRSKGRKAADRRMSVGAAVRAKFGPKRPTRGGGRK